MVVALALEEGVNVALQTQGLNHTPIEGYAYGRGRARSPTPR